MTPKSVLVANLLVAAACLMLSFGCSPQVQVPNQSAKAAGAAAYEVLYMSSQPTPAPQPEPDPDDQAPDQSDQPQPADVDLEKQPEKKPERSVLKATGEVAWRVLKHKADQALLPAEMLLMSAIMQLPPLPTLPCPDGNCPLQRYESAPSYQPPRPCPTGNCPLNTPAPSRPLLIDGNISQEKGAVPRYVPHYAAPPAGPSASCSRCTSSYSSTPTRTYRARPIRRFFGRIFCRRCR